MLERDSINDQAAEPTFREGLALLRTAIVRAARQHNPFARRLVTLALEEDALHLVAFRGDQIVRYSSLLLPPGLIKDGGASDSRQLGKLVSQFLNRNRVGSTKLLWGVSGFHSFSRTIVLPKLPASAVPEAVSRETGRAMPIALEDAHISWQVLSRIDGHQKVFVLVTPRNSLDSIVRALVEAKALSGRVELKPLALARLVNREQAVIVDVQKRTVDVVLMMRWVPVLFRTLSREGSSPISNLAEEISRVIDFYNRNQNQEHLHPEAPLFLTGPLVEDELVSEELARAMQRPLAQVEVGLRAPPGFSTKRYAINLGLALGAPTWKRTVKGQGLALNVLPAAYRPKHGKVELLAMFGAIPLGLAALFLLYQMGTDAAVARDSAQANWYAAQQNIVRNKLAQRESAKAEQALRDVEAQTSSLEKESRTILGQMGTHTLALDVITKLLPPEASIQSVNEMGQQIVVEGKAADYSKALKYIVALEKSGTFPKVTVKSIGLVSPLGAETSFSLDLAQD